MIFKTKDTGESQENKDIYSVAIDYPQENENIIFPKYAVRISARESGIIEISIDKGEWKKCRLSGGYWWFDWSDISVGKHKITVRFKDTNGRILKFSKERKCTFEHILPWE